MAEGFEARYVAGLLRLRALVLVAITAVTVAAGFFAVRVGFAADIESWFVEGDANLVKYHAFLDKFGADEVSVVGVFADDLFTPARLQALDAFTRAAEEAPYTYRVSALTNARVVKRLGPGHVGIEEFLEAVPETPEEAQAARAAALADPLLRGNLLADDARATAVVVELTREGNNFAAKIEHVQALRALMAKHLTPVGLEAHLAGSPSLDDAMFTATERDFGLFGPLGAGVLVLMMLVLFRRFSAVIVPLSVVTIASVWLFGLMGALGIEITLVSSSLVVLIMAVGVADSVHVLSDYYQALMAGHARDAAVRHAVSALLVPCLFTSLTTAAGFLSLLVGDLQPIREFGWLAAVGVMFAFVLSMTFVPCLLALVSPPPARFIERQRSGAVSRLLGVLGRPSRRARRATLLAGALIAIGSGALVTHLNTAANPLNYFLPGAPVRVAMEKVDAALAGSTSFEFLAHTDEDGLKDPRLLARLDTFAHQLESLAGVPRVLSVLDLLRETRKALTDGEQTGLPTTADHPHLAAQLFFFLEGDEDFPTLVRDGYGLARLTARVRMSLANDVTRATDRINAWIAEAEAPIEGGPRLSIESTGYVKLMADMERYLFESQIESLTVAFIVITLMMFVLLRSVKLGLLAMIPNGLPILFGLGFMTLADIPLDPGTIMIGSMALGLVVDDTVHFLVRLRRSLADAPMPAAIERTMSQTGRPIIVTSVVLALGFATLGFGSFTPNVAFGVVSAVVILCALLADLLLLPAVLLVGQKDALNAMWQRITDPEVAERLDRIDVPFNRYGLDPFGISRDHLGGFYSMLGFFYRRYFRCLSFGIEHIPDSGPVMLVGNHSGGLPVDGGMVIASLFFDKEPPRHTHGMVEKFAQHWPVVSPIFSRVGQLTGLPEHAVQLLRAGRVLMVFPEGARGTGKLYKDKYQLVRFGTGFVRLALRTGTPIVPLAFVGGEEAIPTVFHAQRLAKWIGAPYVPITPYLLPLPLPVQCSLHYGEPFRFAGDGTEPDHVIDGYVEQVKSRITALIDEGRVARRARLGGAP